MSKMLAKLNTELKSKSNNVAVAQKRVKFQIMNHVTDVTVSQPTWKSIVNEVNKSLAKISNLQLQYLVNGIAFVKKDKGVFIYEVILAT